ncbi:hypothetical protein OAC51_09320 [Flavobacteriaceae bacterium]|nr:hypothetical protein [Flavobacteriaceae bacterium]
MKYTYLKYFKSICYLVYLFTCCSCATNFSHQLSKKIQNSDQIGLVINLHENVNFQSSITYSDRKIENQFYPIIDQLEKKEQSHIIIKKAIQDFILQQNKKIVDITEYVKRMQDDHELTDTRKISTIQYDPNLLLNQHNIKTILAVNIDYGFQIPKFSNKIKRGYCRVKIKTVNISNGLIKDNLLLFKTSRVVYTKEETENKIENINQAINTAIEKCFYKINNHD